MPSDPNEKVAVHLQRIEDKLDLINGTVQNLLAEIGDAPKLSLRGKRDTVRDRLHNLENTRDTDTLIKRLRQDTWSRAQKNILFALGVAAAIGPWLRLLFT